MISLNKFNLFSIYWSDYGFKKNENPKKWLEEVLEKNQVFIKSQHTFYKHFREY